MILSDVQSSLWIRRLFFLPRTFASAVNHILRHCIIAINLVQYGNGLGAHLFQRNRKFYSITLVLEIWILEFLMNH